MGRRYSWFRDLFTRPWSDRDSLSRMTDFVNMAPGGDVESNLEPDGTESERGKPGKRQSPDDDTAKRSPIIAIIGQSSTGKTALLGALPLFADDMPLTGQGSRLFIGGELGNLDVHHLSASDIDAVTESLNFVLDILGPPPEPDATQADAPKPLVPAGAQ
jgi:hypothetical protein